MDKLNPLDIVEQILFGKIFDAVFREPKPKKTKKTQENKNTAQ